MKKAIEVTITVDWIDDKKNLYIYIPKVFWTSEGLGDAVKEVIDHAIRATTAKEKAN